MGISIVEFSEMTEEQKKRFTHFENMRGIVIPPRVGFAIAYDSGKGHYMGTITSHNGEEGYTRRDKETILIRTCESFLASRPIRAASDQVI
jgi:hypothetical protein